MRSFYSDSSTLASASASVAVPVNVSDYISVCSVLYSDVPASSFNFNVFAAAN